jgi:hypothetical protein
VTQAKFEVVKDNNASKLSEALALKEKSRIENEERKKRETW